MKRAMFLFCGICWLAFGLACAVFSWAYLTAGGGTADAGSLQQIFTPVSSGNIFTGLVHVTGLAALTMVCFAVGMLLFLNGLYPYRQQESKLEDAMKSSQ